jgi:hypothetical protein
LYTNFCCCVGFALWAKPTQQQILPLIIQTAADSPLSAIRNLDIHFEQREKIFHNSKYFFPYLKSLILFSGKAPFGGYNLSGNIN